MKKIVLFLIMIIFCTSFTIPVYAEDELIIVLDPGHGGKDNGTSGTLNGTTYYEKNLNRKVAEYLWENLSQYEGVKVYLTNYDDSQITLVTRSKTAGDLNADLLISLHMNALNETYWGGSEIFVSKGTYLPDFAKETTAIAEKILANFQSLGMKNRGIKTRLTDETDSFYNYPNGAKADYYGIIRNCLLEEVPAMIIEHGYLTNYDDLAFLSKDENLKKLADATTDALVSYYNLQKGSGQKMSMKTQDTVTISDLPTTLTVGDDPITLSGYGGSGNGVLRFETNDNSVLRIQGDKLIIAGPGKANITAVRGTDGEYAARQSDNYIRITVNEAPVTNTPIVTPTPTPTPTTTPSPTQVSTKSPTQTPAETITEKPSDLPTETANASIVPTVIMPANTPSSPSSDDNSVIDTILLITAIIGGISAAIVVSIIVRIIYVQIQRKRSSRR